MATEIIKKILVIGLGNFGSILARSLAAKKYEVVALDVNPEKIQEIRDTVSVAIVGDGCNKAVLNEVHVKDFDLVCISLGKRIDTGILITNYLKEIGVKRIMAKAVSEDHERVLRIVGATDIIFPERDEAIRFADSLNYPNILEKMGFLGDYDIAEIIAPEHFYNKSIKELNLKEKYSIQILAVRNVLVEKIEINPHSTYVIKPDDVLIVLGKKGSLEEISKLK